MRGLLRLTGTLAVAALLLLVVAALVGRRLPRGPQLAYVSWTPDTAPRYPHRLMLYDVRRSLAQPLFMLDAMPNGLSWSPDGKTLAYHLQTMPNTVFLFDAQTRQTQAIAATPDDIGPGYFAWSADSEQIALVNAPNSGTWDTFVLDVATGQARNVTPLPLDQWNPLWSPVDADTLLVQSSGGQVLLLNTATGDSQARQTVLSNRYPARYRWSADGEAIYMISRGASDIVVQRGGEPIQRFPVSLPSNWGHRNNLSFSPDGMWLVTVTASSQSNDLTLFNLASDEQKPLADHPTVDEREPRWSPDGRFIAYTADFNGNTDLVLYDGAHDRHQRLFAPVTHEVEPLWRPIGGGH